MPDYRYKCNNCGFQHNQIHRVASLPDPCPKCRDPRFLEKVPQEVRTENKKEKEKNAGEIVKQTIEEERELIKQEQEARRRMWETPE